MFPGSFPGGYDGRVAGTPGAIGEGLQCLASLLLIGRGMERGLSAAATNFRSFQPA